MRQRCVILLRFILFAFNLLIFSTHATTLAKDTPSSTTKGNTFVAPKEWSLSQQGAVTILEVPEGQSYIVLVDVQADNAEAAVSQAWGAYKNSGREIKLVTEQPDKNGWSKQKEFEYETSPNEKRSVYAGAMFANNGWTVWLYDMAHQVGEKRGAQIGLIFSSLTPKGYSKESFAGKKAHKLDQKRLAELTDFIQMAMQKADVPGVGLGILQDGKVVFADGFGVRDFDKRQKVDADTLFMVASNTKAMTTMLLAKLVDEGKMNWTTPVVDLLPSFRLGDDKITQSVLVEHLICACTGLPRKDMDWIFEYANLTPELAMVEVANTQPTSQFGEMFQYSNLLAAAAGYVGGHVAYPELELGAGYDKAMQTRIYDPLSMGSTTLDFDAALAKNHAEAFGTDIDGHNKPLDMNINRTVIPVRPAGAAWSNVNDMLKYIAFEMNAGVLPNGKQYISRQNVLERQKPMVPLDDNATYGMGLIVDNEYGVKVVHHGGDMFGHHSDMMWLPEFGVAAVVLTSSDPGWLIRSQFRRKLLEVLFDGEDKADNALTTAASNYFKQIGKEVDGLDGVMDNDALSTLVSHYYNKDLGDIDVTRTKSEVIFDFGEWQSRVRSRKNPDGTVSFLTVDPGLFGFEFVVGSADQPQLILRDSQHEYVFEGDK
ncbi:serine hydrolase domain-containing protein [Neptunicella sp.]|uniref:serine hydrolase domain-containing protein n=1 Tax=Neptunicella sp. TaxID=2125986 RepID=UPI003F694BB5